MTTGRHWATTTAAILLLLLGLARGAGGVVLAVQGPATVDSLRVTLPTARLLGAGLIAVAALAIVAAASLLRQKPGALRLTLGVLLLFLLDGALNGSLLFGRPDDAGSLVNLAAAAIIGALAVAGRR